ncbi:TetR-like C-terminal domain-containing protein [soil metagenome]
MRHGLSADRLALEGASLADDVGFDEVTLSALARHVGVKPASLYAHVAGSDDLRARIALFALEELADRASAAMAGRAGRDALAALGGVYRDYAHEHPGRYAAAQLRLDAATAAASAGPRHSAMTRAVLLGYDIPEDDHVHAIRLIGSVFRGFVDLESGGSFSHSEPPAADSWLRVIDAIDSLLRHWDLP